MSDHPLDPIFHPRSIAIVGIPRNLQGVSSDFWYGLADLGYMDHGTLYPVNPNADEIDGIKAYPSLLDCPDPVDHVISAIPSRLAKELVEHCVQKRVRSLHFFTAGFAESGDEELAQLERELVETARAGGVRVLGPNCMGLYVPEERIAFFSGFPAECGNVFGIAQSGGNAMEIVNGLGRRGPRFSKVVSFGNGRDIAAAELFEYAATDDQTEIVVAYLEGVPDGQQLLRAIRACALHKPTIILKGGLSESGARAVNSHTASLAGSKEIFDAMCRQAGAIRVETMEELHDLTLAVATGMRSLRGDRAMLIGGGGGFSVLSADAIARHGIDLPPLLPETESALREFIPIAGNSIRNPIDASFFTTSDRRAAMEEVFRISAAASNIDFLFATLSSAPSSLRRGPGSAPEPTEPDELAELQRRRVAAGLEGLDEFAKLQEESGKVIVGVGWNERRDGVPPDELLMGAFERGVAVFSTVPRAARAVELLLQWRRSREGLPELF